MKEKASRSGKETTGVEGLPAPPPLLPRSGNSFELEVGMVILFDEDEKGQFVDPTEWGVRAALLLVGCIGVLGARFVLLLSKHEEPLCKKRILLTKRIKDEIQFTLNGIFLLIQIHFNEENTVSCVVWSPYITLQSHQ